MNLLAGIFGIALAAAIIRSREATAVVLILAAIAAFLLIGFSDMT